MGTVLVFRCFRKNYRQVKVIVDSQEFSELEELNLLTDSLKTLGSVQQPWEENIKKIKDRQILIDMILDFTEVNPFGDV